MAKFPDEKQYRHDLTYAFMDQEGLDGIIIFGADRSDRYDAGQWFARDRRYQNFVIPRSGDPVMLAFSPQVLAQHFVTLERNLDTWIEDLRVSGNIVEGIPAVVREKKLDTARIGVIGTGFGSPFYPGGWVPKMIWDGIAEALPNVSFVDITAQFGLVMAQKSEHDIENLAKAAAAGDAAKEAMMRIAKPGTTETELYSTAYYELLKRGMRVTWMLFQTGPDNFGWGEPTWLMRPEEPRALAEDDQVWTELFPYYAEMHTILKTTFTIGRVTDETRKCAEAARASYEIGVKEIRPGRSLSEVAGLMDGPLKEIGAWNLTPHITMPNPLMAAAGSGASIGQHVPEFAKHFGPIDSEPQKKDFVIKEGMTFAVQPDVRIGRGGAVVGGVVAVTKDGGRELNTVTNQVQFLD